MFHLKYDLKTDRRTDRRGRILFSLIYNILNRPKILYIKSYTWVNKYLKIME